MFIHFCLNLISIQICFINGFFLFVVCLILSILYPQLSLFSICSFLFQLFSIHCFLYLIINTPYSAYSSSSIIFCHFFLSYVLSHNLGLLVDLELCLFYKNYIPRCIVFYYESYIFDVLITGMNRLHLLIGYYLLMKLTNRFLACIGVIYISKYWTWILRKSAKSIGL